MDGARGHGLLVGGKVIRGVTREQPRAQHRGRKTKKNREIFRETRAVFAKCIITKIVIWLLNRLGLSKKIFGGGAGWNALQNICDRAPSSHDTPLKVVKAELTAV